MKRCLLILLLVMAPVTQSLATYTDKIMMVRSDQSFPETMTSLQLAIKKHGYKLSRIQRVDIGLTHSGFKTDKYRIVFFSKPDEFHMLVDKYPELIPYLPLKIAIFAENDQTILISANPLIFMQMYHDKELKAIFERWQNDIIAILNSVQKGE